MDTQTEGVDRQMHRQTYRLMESIDRQAGEQKNRRST
jgi:hypothetical protein